MLRKCTRTSVALFIAAAVMLITSVCGLAAHFNGEGLRVISLANSSWDGFSSSEVRVVRGFSSDPGHRRIPCDQSHALAVSQGITLEIWVRCLDTNVRWNTIINYCTLHSVVSCISGAPVRSCGVFVSISAPYEQHALTV